ncbi:MAG: hypothetical protein LC798_12955 [Chloroflexi bacterium]|nr:hypothetical protein [Chloroflexota bacterium]
MRAAKAVLGEREAHATQIASDVFNVTLEHATREGEEADPLPLELRGPLAYLGLRCASALVPLHKLDPSDVTVADVTAYLTEGYCSMFEGFDVAHFEQWRRANAAAAELLGTCQHCQKPGVEHRLDADGLRWCEDGSLAALPDLKLKDEEPCE